MTAQKHICTVEHAPHSHSPCRWVCAVQEINTPNMLRMRQHNLAINKNLCSSIGYSQDGIPSTTYPLRFNQLNSCTPREWSRVPQAFKRRTTIRCSITATHDDIFSLFHHSSLGHLNAAYYYLVGIFPNILLHGQIYHIKSLQWIFGWPTHTDMNTLRLCVFRRKEIKMLSHSTLKRLKAHIDVDSPAHSTLK